jgi:hypothetical protein
VWILIKYSVKIMMVMNMNLGFHELIDHLKNSSDLWALLYSVITLAGIFYDIIFLL